MRERKNWRPPEVNPVTRSAFRRQVWLEIYLPLALGLVAVVGAAWSLWRSGMAAPSAWADASTILLILPVLAVSLIPLLILIALSVGIILLVRRLPEATQRLQSIIYRVQWSVRRGADVAVKPWLMGESAGSAGRTGIAVLLSIFRRRKGS
jgi:small-conductance mechanosensitive channel